MRNAYVERQKEVNYYKDRISEVRGKRISKKNEKELMSLEERLKISEEKLKNTRDPFTQDITEKDIEDLKDDKEWLKYKPDKNTRDLFDNFTPKQIKWMMNNIAKGDKVPGSGQEVLVAKNGLSIEGTSDVEPKKKKPAKKENNIVFDPQDKGLHKYLDSLNLYKGYQEQLRLIPEDEKPRDNFDPTWNNYWEPDSDNSYSEEDWYKGTGEWGKYYGGQKMGTKNERNLTRYYDTLDFKEPAMTGYWGTPDLGHSSIKASGSYMGEGSHNPIYKKPTNEIKYYGDPNDYLKYRSKVMVPGNSKFGDRRANTIPIKKVPSRTLDYEKPIERKISPGPKTEKPSEVKGNFINAKAGEVTEEGTYWQSIPGKRGKYKMVKGSESDAGFGYKGKGKKPGPTAKQRDGVRENDDGTVSTHLMAREYVPGRGWVTFPTLLQDEDGTWVDNNTEDGYGKPLAEAEKRGEVNDFGDDEEGAIKFADEGSWKKPERKKKLGAGSKARGTWNTAPVNYAKGTQGIKSNWLDSYEDGTDELKRDDKVNPIDIDYDGTQEVSFNEQYINSPKYKERLKKEIDAQNKYNIKSGYNRDNYYDDMGNLNVSKMMSEKPKYYQFVDKGDLFLNEEIKKRNENLKTVKLDTERKPERTTILGDYDPIDHSYAVYKENLGGLVNETEEDVTEHEKSHSSTRGDKGLFKATIKKINDFTEENKSLREEGKLNTKNIEYLTDPSEVKARMDSARRYLKEKSEKTKEILDLDIPEITEINKKHGNINEKIHNPLEEDFTKEDYEELKNSKSSDAKELLKNFTEEQVIWMFNNIAKGDEVPGSNNKNWLENIT
jgi:hypothetical protein